MLLLPPGSVFLLLLLGSFVGAEKEGSRSLFDDLVPSSKLTKRHFDVDGTQEKPCNGRRSSEACSPKDPKVSVQTASSLFDQLPKMSEPVKTRSQSGGASPSSPVSPIVSKYVPAPYEGQDSSQSLFDEYMTKEATLPSSIITSRTQWENSASSKGTFGRNGESSKSGSFSSTSALRKNGGSSSSASDLFGRNGESLKKGSSSTSSDVFGRNVPSTTSESILDKEKEALENLSNYVLKEALQTSRFERDSSKNDLNMIANSAQTLKNMIDGGFQDMSQLPSDQIDRNFTPSEDRRKLSKGDLRALANLLSKDDQHPIPTEFSPENEKSFAPFLDEVKLNRLRDLKLALKIMKRIEQAKEHGYADQGHNEDLELNLAQLLFDVNIGSLSELTRTQRESLDTLMRKMETRLRQDSGDSSDGSRASLSQLLNQSENDFSFGFYRPPPPKTKKQTPTYLPPDKPSGLYGRPTVTTRRPPTTAVGPPGPPTTRRPTVRPPAITRPPSTTRRPVGPPGIPLPPSPPVGPPGPPPPTQRPMPMPPGFNPSQTHPLDSQSDDSDLLFLSPEEASFDDEDDTFFLAPGPDDLPRPLSDDLDDDWLPLPLDPSSTYARPPSTEPRAPPTTGTGGYGETSSSGGGANHNYHYHYHTLSINPNQRRDMGAPRNPSRSLSVAKKGGRGRTRRPNQNRLASPPQRNPVGVSSYTSVAATAPIPADPLPLEYGLPRDPPPAAEPLYPPLQQAAEPVYGPPPVPRDPVPAYRPPAAEPIPRDPTPAYRPPPAAEPRPREPQYSYGPPPADPPPMTYGPPPPQDPPQRDPEPPRTQTRVVFLSPVKEKEKQKFWKKDKKKGNFNAFSVLFDEGPQFSPQSDDNFPRSPSQYSSRDPNRRYRQDDEYNNRRDDLRDQFWRNRERLFRQQQQAFDLQRLRLEIELQERQRKEMKKGLFRSLLRDDSSDSGGGIMNMFYKGAQALGAMTLMPLSNLIGRRRKRDLSSYNHEDAPTELEFVEMMLKSSLKTDNLGSPQDAAKKSQKTKKKKYIPKSIVLHKKAFS